LVDEKYIREEEKEIIKYVSFYIILFTPKSKRGLLNYFECLENLSDFDLLYNQNNLVLKTRKNGSDISSSFMLGKTVYTLPLSKFDQDVSIDLISELIYNTEERIKWDKTLKIYKKVHEDENFFVTQAWIFSPIVLVSERDHIDKRISFSNDGKFYHFCSAIPDGVMEFY
jgi:hypothetical protein